MLIISYITRLDQVLEHTNSLKIEEEPLKFDHFLLDLVTLDGKYGSEHSERP